MTFVQLITWLINQLRNNIVHFRNKNAWNSEHSNYIVYCKKKKKIYAGIITISMHLHTVLTRVAPLILLIKEIMRLLKAITVTEQDLYIHSWDVHWGVKVTRVFRLHSVHLNGLLIKYKIIKRHTVSEMNGLELGLRTAP